MNEALRDWVTNVARHLLLHRHGRRPASLSGHGARLPVDHRRGDARADARRGGPPARIRSSPASAAARTRSACSTRSWTTARSRSSGSRRPATGSSPDARGLAHRRTPGRAARQPHLSSDGRGRPDPRRPFDLGRASTIRASGPSTPGSTMSAGCTYLAATDKEALEAFQLCSKLEGIIPALEPAHALAKMIELAPERPHGPPDGAEPLRPRRQGHPPGRGDLRTSLEGGVPALRARR